MGRRDSKAAAEQAMDLVGMTENMGRAIRGYSKGMRQRTKLAQALVHGPRVLFLDEPFTGTDPVARRDLIEVIRGLGAAGHSVLVSSHVLHEIHALTQNIALLHRGRLVAEGNVRQIRDLIDQHPHRIVLVCDDYRALAAKVVGWDDVEGVKLMARGDNPPGQELRSEAFSERPTTATAAPGRVGRDGALLVETRRPDNFYGMLTAMVAGGEARVREVYSDDDNLEAVFKYLVSR
jgi:ABC-2 type transport system ATP-binding protein